MNTPTELSAAKEACAVALAERDQADDRVSELEQKVRELEREVKEKTEWFEDVKKQLEDFEELERWRQPRWDALKEEVKMLRTKLAATPQ